MTELQEKRPRPPAPYLLQGVRHPSTTGIQTIRDRIRELSIRAEARRSDGSPLVLLPHDCRRVFASEHLNNNTPVHVIQALLGHASPDTARDVLTAISPVWDETLVLAGSAPGKVVAEARRSGKQWFIAVINGGDPTSLDIPLDFLGAGSWQAIQLRDAKDKPDAWDRQVGKATRNDHIRLEIAPRGGFVGWIHQ